MLVLLRAKLPNVEVWGIPLLIKQTKDQEHSVVLSALEILAEATHEKVYFINNLDLMYYILLLILLLLLLFENLNFYL